MSHSNDELLLQLRQADDQVDELLVLVEKIAADTSVDAALGFVDFVASAGFAEQDDLLRRTKDLGRASDTPAPMVLLMARCAEMVCENHDTAIELYRTAFKRDHTELRALLFARQVYARLGQYVQVGKLWELEVRALRAGTRARAEAYVGLAETRLVHFDDEAGTREALRGALSDDPENEHALELLEMLGPEEADGDETGDDTGADAAETAEDTGADTGEDKDAGTGEDTGAETGEDTGADTGEDTGADTGDTDTSESSEPEVEPSPQAAVDDVPDAGTITKAELNDWLASSPPHASIGRLVDAFEAGLRSAASNDERMRFGVLAGLACWKGLGDHRRASGAFKRVRLSEPSNLDALEFAVAFAEAENDLDTLLLAYVDLARAQPDVRSETLVTGRAAAAAVDAGDEVRGLDLWYRVLDMDPHSLEAWSQVDRLSESSGKWGRLTTLLKERLQQADLSADDRARMVRRLFLIYRDRVNAPAPADTLAEELWASEQWDEAAQWLVARYTENGRWSELIALHEQQAEAHADGSEEWVDLLLQAVDVSVTGMNRPDLAADLLRRILAALPAGQSPPPRVLAALQSADQGELLVTARRQQLLALPLEEQAPFAAATVKLATEQAEKLLPLAELDLAVAEGQAEALPGAVKACGGSPDELLSVALALPEALRVTEVANALFDTLPVSTLGIERLEQLVQQFGPLVGDGCAPKLLVALARQGLWDELVVRSTGMELSEDIQDELEAVAVEHPVGWTFIARMNAQAGRRLQEAEAWQRAWAAEHEDSALLKAAAQAFEAAQEWEQAAGCWDMLMADDALSADEVAHAAMLRIEHLNDVDSAMSAVLALLAGEPAAEVVAVTLSVAQTADRLDAWFDAWDDADAALRSAVEVARSSGELALWEAIAGRASSVGDADLEAEATSRLLGAATDGESRAKALARLAALEESAGRVAAAEGYAAEALKADAGNTLATDVLVRLAEVHESTTAADVVEPLLRAQGRTLELLRLLDARATRAQPQSAELWLEVADLAEQIDDHEWSLMAVSRLLDLQVPGQELWDRLGRITTESERAGRWFVAIEQHGLAPLQWSIEPLVAYLRAESRHDLLVDLWSRAKRLPELQSRALRELTELYIDEVRIEELEALCHDDLDGVDARERAAILCRAAAAVAAIPGRVDDATELYRAALLAEPADRTAFTGLRELYLTTGANLEAEMLIDRRLEALGDGDEHIVERAELFTLMAEALWDENGDLGRIVELLEKAVEHADPERVRHLAQNVFDAVGGGDPESPAAGALIARSLERLSDADDRLRVHLEDWLVRAEEGDRAQVHLRLMRLALKEGDEDTAFEHARLGAPGLADPLAAEAMLLEAAERTGRYGDVLGLLEDVAARAESAGIWLRLVDLYLEHLDAPDMAAEALVMALDLGLPADVNEPEQLDRLVELRQQAGDEAGTARALLRRAAASPGEASERASQCALAGAQLLQAGLAPEAADAFARALELDPDNSKAIEQYPELLQAQERWPELADFLLERLAVDARGPLHRRLALVLRDYLHDVDEAVFHFEAAGELDSSDAESWRAAAELHLAAGRDSMQISALRRLLATGPDDADDIRLRLAGLLVKAEASGPEALELLSAVSTAIDGESQERRVELLQRLANQPSTALAATADLLELFSQDESRVAERAQTLMQRANLDLPAADRAPLLLEAAGIFESALDEPQSALHALLEAFALAPAEELLVTIQRVAAQTSAYYAVSDAFEPLLRSVLPVKTLASMHAVLADLAKAIGDGDDAAMHASEAYRLDPGGIVSAVALASMLAGQSNDEQLLALLEQFADDPAGFSELLSVLSVDALAALLGQLSDDDVLGQRFALAGALVRADLVAEHHPVMASSLARRLADAEESSEAADRYLCLSIELAASAGEYELALHALLDRIEQAPELWSQTQEQLVELARKSGNWERVVHVLRECADVLDVEESSTLLLNVARIQLEFLNDDPGAVATLTSSVVRNPSHVATHDLLLTRLQRAADHPAAIEELKRWVEVAPDLESRVDAMLKIAATWRDALGEIEQAIPWLHEAVAAAPGHPTASSHLLSAIERAGRWEELDELLTARSPRSLEDTLRLTRVRLLRLGLTRDADTLLQELRAHVDGAAADVRADTLNTFGRILADTLHTLRDDDPHKASIAAMAAGLFGEIGDEACQVDALRVAVRTEREPGQRCALNMRLASLLVELEPAQALDCVVAALNDSPDSDEAADLTVAIAGQLDRISEAVAALERAADHVSSARAVELLTRAADLADSMLEDRSLSGRLLTRAALAEPGSPAAATLLEQVREEPSGPVAQQLWTLAPSDARALELLTDAIGNDAPPSERARLLNMTLETVAVDADKAALHRELASLASDDDARIHHLADAVVLEPDDEDLLAALADEATGPENAFRVVAALEEAAAQGVRLPASLLLADVLRGPAADADAAIDLLLRVREHHPGSPPVLQRLTTLLADAGRLDELAAILRDDAAAFSGEQRQENLLRAAELFDEAGDTESALSTLQLAESTDRRHEIFDRIADAGSEYSLWADDLMKRAGDSVDELAGDWLMKAAWAAEQVPDGQALAVSALRAAVRIPAVADDARQMLLHQYRANERHQDAYDLLTEMLAACTDDETRADLLRQRVLTAEEWQEASALQRAMYEMALAAGPSSDESAEYVEHLRARADNEHLVEWLRVCVESGDGVPPGTSSARIALAEALLRGEGGVDEAFAVLEPLLSDDGSLTEEVALLASSIASRRGDADGAREIVARAVSHAAGEATPRLRARMALEFKRGGAPSLQWSPMLIDAVTAGAVDDEILDALEEAGDAVGAGTVADAYANAAQSGLTLTPARWVRWAMHLHRTGRRADAISRLLGVVRSGSTDADMIRTLVELQVEAGQFDAAAEVLADWAELPSVRSSRAEQPVVFYLRGKLALANGQRAQALDAYRRAMTLDTSYVPNLLALATLLLGQQEYEDADRVATAALQHQSALRDQQERARLLRLIGDIKERLGDTARASTMRQRAAEIEAGSSGN